MEEMMVMMIPELSYDVVELILLKLSTKSLVRFKCVSKKWKDLISSPKFVYRQWRESRRAVKICPSYIAFRHCMRPEYKKYFIRFSQSQADEDVGRVACKIHESFSLPYISYEDEIIKRARNQLYPAGFGIYAIFEFSAVGKVAMLWNPTMRQLKVLPPSPYPSADIDARILYFYGFAHVEYKDGIFSYKVGFIRNKPYAAEKLHAMTIEIYSSTDNTWRLMEDCYRFSCNGYPFGGRNLNGKFHWLTWFSKDKTHIGTFDLSTEEFGRLEVPLFLAHDNVTYSILTEFDNKYLCLLLYREIDDEVSVEAWVMLEYGITESWTKQSTVGPIADHDYVQVLAAISGDNNYNIGGVFFQNREFGEGLFFCRYGSKEVDTLLPAPHSFALTRDVIEYEESLVSLDGISDRRIELELSSSS